MWIDYSFTINLIDKVFHIVRDSNLLFFRGDSISLLISLPPLNKTTSFWSTYRRYDSTFSRYVARSRIILENFEDWSLFIWISKGYYSLGLLSASALYHCFGWNVCLIFCLGYLGNILYRESSIAKLYKTWKVLVVLTINIKFHSCHFRLSNDT